MQRLLAGLPRALERWARTDPTLAAVARRNPPRRADWVRRTPFARLCESFTHQQVSLAAGRTIYRNLVAACSGRLTPQRVLEAGDARLQAAGLSAQKRSYVVGLARSVQAGAIDFRKVARLADEEAIAALTELRGVGRWTAQMFLLFHLQRPDVLAPDDLGLQIAAARIYDVPMRRARALLASKGGAWSPYASLASLTLWENR